VSDPRTLGCTLAIVALSAGWVTGHGSPTEDIFQAEQARTAALRAGDVDALKRLLADDYTDVDVHGRLRGRTEALSIDPDTPMTEGATVHRHGKLAIVVGRERDARVMRLWIYGDGAWRVVAEQVVRIQPGTPETDPSPEVLAQSRLLRAVDDDAPVRDVFRAQDALDRANATGDPVRFAALTAPDFVLVTAHGLVRTKADRVIEERIRQLEGRPSRPLARRDDEHIRLYGRVAVITARSWPRAPDGHARRPFRFTRVWVQQSSGWQQLANIATPVAP
jgi:ketosteroid isomerase-like protein